MPAAVVAEGIVAEALHLEALYANVAGRKGPALGRGVIQAVDHGSPSVLRDPGAKKQTLTRGTDPSPTPPEATNGLGWRICRRFDAQFLASNATQPTFATTRALLAFSCRACRSTKLLGL
jgi:hypothetical protein